VDRGGDQGRRRTLRHILDDRFVATFGAAKPLDREGFIKEVIGSDTDKIVSQDLSDETVRVDGDTAVVVETDTVRGTDNGEPYTQVLRITTTYIKRHGGWVALAEHVAAVKPVVDVAADEAAIRKADAEWVKAAETRGVDAWLAFYADEAVVLPPNDKVANSRASVRKSVGELLALPDLSISWHPTKVEIARSGDIAYLTGAYELSFRATSGKTVADQGKLLEIWKKQPDGSWKCIVDTWNSDLPASPPTTS
jgi:ketosteroid isomerase-like protein